MHCTSCISHKQCRILVHKLKYLIDLGLKRVKKVVMLEEWDFTLRYYSGLKLQMFSLLQKSLP